MKYCEKEFMCACINRDINSIRKLYTLGKKETIKSIDNLYGLLQYMYMTGNEPIVTEFIDDWECIGNKFDIIHSFCRNNDETCIDLYIDKFGIESLFYGKSKKMYPISKLSNSTMIKRYVIMRM